MAAIYSVLKVSLLHQYIDINGTLISTIPYAFNTAFSNVNSFTSFFVGVYDFIRLAINFKALGLGVIFGIGIFAFKKHPIIYIAAGAFVGICFSMYEAIVI